MGQLSEFLFSPWIWVLLIIAFVTYMLYAFMEHKWPFRHRDR